MMQMDKLLCSSSGSLAAGGEGVSQHLHEAVDVAEAVVERHRSDSQHAGLPHVALSHITRSTQHSETIKTLLEIFKKEVVR